MGAYVFIHKLFDVSSFFEPDCEDKNEFRSNIWQCVEIIVVQQPICGQTSIKLEEILQIKAFIWFRSNCCPVCFATCKHLSPIAKQYQNCLIIKNFYLLLQFGNKIKIITISMNLLKFLKYLSPDSKKCCLLIILFYAIRLSLHCNWIEY